MNDARVYICQFLDEVYQIDSTLGLLIREMRKEWEPDAAPDIILFSHLGSGIIDRYQTEGLSYFKKFVSLLERGIISESEYLRTLVATGLIEAIASSSIRASIWDEVKPALGERARQYVNAWLDS